MSLTRTCMQHNEMSGRGTLLDLTQRCPRSGRSLELSLFCLKSQLVKGTIDFYIGLRTNQSDKSSENLPVVS